MAQVIEIPVTIQLKVLDYQDFEPQPYGDGIAKSPTKAESFRDWYLAQQKKPEGVVVSAFGHCRNCRNWKPIPNDNRSFKTLGFCTTLTYALFPRGYGGASEAMQDDLKTPEDFGCCRFEVEKA